jgi:response regulator RpfG family c-di-GMP phosphodiesterase
VRSHTIHGARLFFRRNHHPSPWDRMAAEVALNHHERWDGMGYPGRIENLHAHTIRFGPGKKAHEIPLSGRIVALADVYDALLSERSYKERWRDTQAIGYIRQQAGRHFDPELVQIFLRLHDKEDSVFKKIQRQYV